MQYYQSKIFDSNDKYQSLNPNISKARWDGAEKPMPRLIISIYILKYILDSKYLNI